MILTKSSALSKLDPNDESNQYVYTKMKQYYVFANNQLQKRKKPESNYNWIIYC